MTHSPAERPRTCPCCGHQADSSELGLASPFFSSRAALSKPAPVELARCGRCLHAWSLRGLSDQEAARLYVGYRGEEYFKQRHATEPWYSRRVNDGIGSEAAMDGRRAVLADFLARAAAKGGERPVGRCVDFGGDRGQMLRDLPDAGKFVHDLSGAAPEAWASRLADPAREAASFDLAMNCQVLEHVNDPLAVLRETAALARPGGWLYVEVPDERWSCALGANGPLRRRWLEAVAKSGAATMALDFASTAFRIKFGWIPPGGFWALREHINFFSPSSLSMLMLKAGLDPILCAASPSGISAVGCKRR